MSVEKFQFGPQPALDKARADQEKCEQALGQALKLLAAEKEKLRQIEAQIQQTRQQIAAETDKLFEETRRGVSGQALVARDAYARALRQREAKQQAERDEQQQQVRFAGQKVALRRQELAEVQARVSALEKVRARMLAEHGKSVAKREERKQDDVTSLYHKPRRS